MVNASTEAGVGWAKQTNDSSTKMLVSKTFTLRYCYRLLESTRIVTVTASLRVRLFESELNLITNQEEAFDHHVICYYVACTNGRCIKISNDKEHPNSQPI